MGELIELRWSPTGSKICQASLSERSKSEPKPQRVPIRARFVARETSFFFEFVVCQRALIDNKLFEELH